jgi:type I restriction-modification system DNA methylase subunit
VLTYSGSLDPADYHQPMMTLLFLKRLNDTFEENTEKLIQEGKSEKQAYGNKIGTIFLSLKKQDSHFFLPQQKKLMRRLTM